MTKKSGDSFANGEARLFTIGQTAMFLFDLPPGRGTSWLRWKEKEGYLKTSKGATIGQRRGNNKQGGGDRVYTVDDMEEIVSALRERGVLDAKNTRTVMKRINSLRTPVEVIPVTPRKV